MVHPDAAPLDQMADRFLSTVGDTRAHEQAVPERFEFETDVEGHPFRLSVRAFVGDKVAFGRLARVDAADNAQVLNLAVFPRLSTTLPILGVEIVSIRDGLSLVVFDLFQIASSDVSMRLKEHLQAARDELSQGFELEDHASWGDSIYSESAIILRPGAQTKTRLSTVEAPLFRLLERYGDTVRRYEPTVLRGLERSRRRRAQYLASLAGEEPLGAILEHVRDDAWVDAFSREFLYPEWLQSGDQLPPWLDQIDISG
jgi:hypothetical protein